MQRLGTGCLACWAENDSETLLGCEEQTVGFHHWDWGLVRQVLGIHPANSTVGILLRMEFIHGDTHIHIRLSFPPEEDCRSQSNSSFWGITGRRRESRHLLTLPDRSLVSSEVTDKKFTGCLQSTFYDFHRRTSSLGIHVQDNNLHGCHVLHHKKHAVG